MAKQQTQPWHDEPAHRVQDLVGAFAQAEEGEPERLRAGRAALGGRGFA